jgi:hypothetical protein
MSGTTQYALYVKRPFGSYTIGQVITDQTVVADILSGPFASWVTKVPLSGGTGTTGGDTGGGGTTPPPTGATYVTGISITGNNLVYTLSTGATTTLALPVSTGGSGGPTAPYVTSVAVSGTNIVSSYSDGSNRVVALPISISGAALSGNSIIYTWSDGSQTSVDLPQDDDTTPTLPTLDLADIADLTEYPGTPGNVLALDANGKLTDEPLTLSAVKDATEYPGTPGNFLALDQLARLTDLPPVMASIQDLAPFPGAPLSLLGFDAAGRPTTYPLAGNSATVTVNTPTNAMVGNAVLLTGTATGSTPLAMDYSINGGSTWAAISPFTPNGGTWSGVGPIPTAAGAMTITVRDHNYPSVTAATSAFTVAPGLPTETITINTPSSATQGIAVPLSGTYANVQPTSMDYSVDGGTTWVGMTGFTSGSGAWNGNGPAPVQTGSLTITVRDHVAPTIQASTNPFTVNPGAAVLPTITAPLYAVDTSANLGQFWQDQAFTVPGALGLPVKGLLSSIDSTDQLRANTAPTWMSGVKGRMNGLRFTAASKTVMFQGTTIPFVRTLDGNAIVPESFTMLCVFTPATQPTSSNPMTLFTLGVAGRSYDMISLGITQNSLAFTVWAQSGPVTAAISMVPAANGVIAAVVRYTNNTVPMKLAAQGFTEVSVVPNVSLSGTPWGMAFLGTLQQSSNGYQPFDGWLHEWRIWSVVATDAQRDSLLTYANRKWGT